MSYMYVKNLSNNVPRLYFLYKLKVKSPLSLQSNSLSRFLFCGIWVFDLLHLLIILNQVRLSLTFSERPACLPFCLVTQNTLLTNHNTRFSKLAATCNVEICCVTSWEGRYRQHRFSTCNATLRDKLSENVAHITFCLDLYIILITSK